MMKSQVDFDLSDLDRVEHELMRGGVVGVELPIALVKLLRRARERIAELELHEQSVAAVPREILGPGDSCRIEIIGLMGTWA